MWVLMVVNVCDGQLCLDSLRMVDPKDSEDSEWAAVAAALSRSELQACEVHVSEENCYRTADRGWILVELPTMTKEIIYVETASLDVNCCCQLDQEYIDDISVGTSNCCAALSAISSDATPFVAEPKLESS
jgi:hypothetical protein